MPQNKVVANVVQKVRAVTKCHISLKTMVLKFQDRQQGIFARERTCGARGEGWKVLGDPCKTTCHPKRRGGWQVLAGWRKFHRRSACCQDLPQPTWLRLLEHGLCQRVSSPPPPTESLCLSVVTTPTRHLVFPLPFLISSVLGHLLVHLCCTSVDYNWAPVAACVPVTLKICRPTRCKNASF